VLTVTAATGRVFLTSWSSGKTLRQQASGHPFFAGSKHNPEVIAHRGGDGQWPGETMQAMRQARDIGVDLLEMDVYLTRDGQLALMHDINIKKTTNGKGLIQKFTLAELQNLNAGYNWSGDGGKTFPYRKNLNELPQSTRNAFRVPSLKEVFEEFPEMRMVVEMKPALRSPAPALCNMIRDHGMTNKVIVASFWAPFMKEFRGLCGAVATSASISAGDLKKFLLGNSANDNSVGATAIEVPYQFITEALVKKARERNLKIHAWTVNNPADMNRMIGLGVDGIMTDYPGPLLALLTGKPQPA